MAFVAAGGARRGVNGPFKQRMASETHMEKNPMRMHLHKILSLAAGLTLVACDIPDDGFAELSGTIQIPGTLLPLVVMPDGTDSDCDVEAEGWGDSLDIGDTTPTLYVGLYKNPLDPLSTSVNATDGSSWYKGCGEIDEDDNPVTPPISHDEACPIGGTTATYVQTIAGTNGMAVFEFKALQLPTGNAYLIAWLDNKCAPDNEPSANLVWQISGPPGPVDDEGNEPTDDPPADPDENDLMNFTPLAIDIGSGGNSLDAPLVLNSALSASML